jgi:nucleoid-associated protein YgaU
VQPGDTLSGIAGQFFGVTLSALEAANPQITNPNLIVPGQVIRIP